MEKEAKIEIQTEITNKEIDKALMGGLNELWEVTSSLEGDEELEDEIEKVKWGIKLKFDIRAITEGHYQMEVAFNQVRIERKQKVDLTEFRDEIEARKKIMKDILRGLYEEGFDKQKEEEIKGYE